jgi:hypothetical protein
LLDPVELVPKPLGLDPVLEGLLELDELEGLLELDEPDP